MKTVAEIPSSLSKGRGITLKVVTFDGHPSQERMVLEYQGISFLHRRVNPRATKLPERTMEVLEKIKTPDELYDKLTGSKLWTRMEPENDFPPPFEEPSEDDLDAFLAGEGLV